MRNELKNFEGRNFEVRKRFADGSRELIDTFNCNRVLVSDDNTVLSGVCRLNKVELTQIPWADPLEFDACDERKIS